MIENNGRWPNTVCLRCTSSDARNCQDSFGAFRDARCIEYSKSWTRALPRLALSLPLGLMAVLFLSAIIGPLGAFLPRMIFLIVGCLIVVAAVFMSFSIFWRPAVSRSVKIELKRALRPEHSTSSLPSDPYHELVRVAIHFVCPWCTKSISVDESRARERVECPYCNFPVKVPAKSTHEPEPESSPPPPPG
jgi:DNA-directed RNA polymerase subunit RPC12/RpoP